MVNQNMAAPRVHSKVLVVAVAVSGHNQHNISRDANNIHHLQDIWVDSMVMMDAVEHIEDLIHIYNMWANKNDPVFEFHRIPL